MGSDIEAGRGFLWWPVAFGLGAALYFLLPFEPSRAGSLTAAALLPPILLLWRVLGKTIPVFAILLVCAAFGFAAATLSVMRAAAPVLEYQRSVTVTGTVETVEERAGRGYRLLLRLERMAPSPREGLPRRARISVRGDDLAIAPGERVRLLARVGPPQAPVYPGSYDFTRAAYFQQIGAVGFSLGKLEKLPPLRPESRIEELALEVEQLRLAVSQRIRTIVPGDAGAIAAALIVGDRGAITPEADEAMRISGLSHVLSISGLHMTIVAACLFASVRALLAALPHAVLFLPAKTIAAVAALAGTLLYLIIAGASLPTQRSAVMISVSLVAIMAGRQAFSLRSVAIAALCVLIVQPEAVLDPGAQLSFAATTALIAGFEAILSRSEKARDSGDINRAVRLAHQAATWLWLSLMTALIAGLATAPIAIHHFNRSAPLGIVANLATMPIVSFLIMPSAVLAALMIPLGLEWLPLKLMGIGIDLMLTVAETVAGWTPGAGAFGRPPLAAILLMVSGGLWLCLWTGRVRRLGLVPIVLGLLLVPLAVRPDLIVAGDGRRLMIHPPGKDFVVVGRADRFETPFWLAAVGDSRAAGDATLVHGVSCDKEACILPWPEGTDNQAQEKTVLAAVVFLPEAFGEECEAAILIVTPLQAPPWCHERARVIDGEDLARTGAATFAIDWEASSPFSEGGPRSFKPHLRLLERALPEKRRPWMSRNG